MISIRQVTKVYPNGVRALSGLNLEVKQGEFCFIVGPSGAGKSTLMKLLYRAEVPTSGQVIISGVDNVLKPYLISRGGNLPLVIVLLGVFGGLIAFGFIGLFIGPTLLAVGYSLLLDWSRNAGQQTPQR